LKWISLDCLTLTAAWLLLLAIAMAAIMPHARQRSKPEVTHALSAKRNRRVRRDISTSSLRAQRFVRQSFGEGGNNPEMHPRKDYGWLRRKGSRNDGVRASLFVPRRS
jgi:hypothetical protein